MYRMLKTSTIFVLALLLVAFSAFAGNLVQNGDMESEEGWSIFDFKDNGTLEYEFGFTGDTLAFGMGGCLYISQMEDAGQFLLYQRITLKAGQKYRLTGALNLLDYNPAEGGGTWYQMYISEEEVDETATDYNPQDDKILDVGDGWDRESGFFNSLWEDVNLSTVLPSCPYYIAPGTPGEEVEVTFAIKFGQYYPDYSGAFFEVLVDEVGLYPVEEAVNAGGDMESEDGWNITDYKDNGSLEYEFGFTGDSLAYGEGGNLYISQMEDAGQFLLWQRVKVIGGQKYRLTGSVNLLDYNGADGGGTWYQMYISEEEVDEEAGEYNPTDDKVISVGEGWGSESGFFNDLWEVINLSTVLPTCPVYIAPGAEGEEVEVTFAIKFGQYYPDYTGAFFEVLVDEVYLLPMEGESGSAVKEDAPVVINEFELGDNYPNPFNPSTTIDYTINTKSNVRLTVFDVLGQEVASLVNEEQAQGRYSVKFDASDLANGVYFYRLEAGNNMMTKKLTLMK